MLGLEAIRGLLSIIVVCGHLVSKQGTLRAQQNHIINLLTVWGRECVLMFFILSGIVIHYSYVRHKRSASLFLKQRILRLHPTIFLALLLSIIVEIFLLNHNLSINIIIGNLVPYATMNAYLAPLLWDTNPPIWSLTFELFFYGIFAIVVIRKRRISNTAILIWLLCGLGSIYFYYHPFNSNILNHLVLMLSFSPIWLIGFYIYKYKDKFFSNFNLALVSLSLLPLLSRLHITNDYYDPIKFIFFAITTYPFFVFVLPRSENNHSNRSTFSIEIYLIATFLTSIYIIFNDVTYSKSVKILYITLPIATVLLLRIKIIIKSLSVFLKKWFVPFFAFFGKYSYSIYLIHFPIIVAIEKTSFSLPLKLTYIIIIIAVCSYFIEHKIQPFFSMVLKKRESFE